MVNFARSTYRISINLNIFIFCSHGWIKLELNSLNLKLQFILKAKILIQFQIAVESITVEKDFFRAVVFYRL